MRRRLRRPEPVHGLTVGVARDFARRLLVATGVPESESELTARALVVADSWGVHSHGLLRLPIYLGRIRAGGVDPTARLVVRKSRGASVVYDGQTGLGQWQVWRAAEAAAALAETHGIGAVAVGNSSHCGCLGVFTLPGLDRGFLTIVTTNGPAVMPPWGGHEPILGTSPIAAGIPCAPVPAIVDLATTTVARGRVMEHAKRDEPLPDGWAFDANGQPTNDPHLGLAGMLAPLGGAKGFALAFLMESLTGGLVGPALSRDVADLFRPETAATPQRISHLVISIDPDAFDVDGSAQSRLDELADAATWAGGRLPGATRVRPVDSQSVALPAAAVVELAEWADRLDVSAPAPFA